jgi:putative membrane protein
MDWGNLLVGIIETAIYSLVGIVMMGLCFLIVRVFTPFSVKKEIEDDQNTSLGIIIGAIILGISIIVASVISSPTTLATKAERIETKSVSETQK